MEEEADIQTITNTTDAYQTQRTCPKKSSTHRKSTEIQQIVEKKRIKIGSGKFRPLYNHFMGSYASPDGLVVRALRCHRSNPGSTTGLDRLLFAKEITGRGSTHRDKRKTTDASQIHEKVTQQKEVPFDFRQNLPCCRTNVTKTSAGNIRPNQKQFLFSSFGHNRLVVRTLRCGRSNPGSNPGLD